jgi:FixJ family two-component response regulator
VNSWIASGVAKAPRVLCWTFACPVSAAWTSELQATNANLPIVFITGHADIPMSVRAMNGGAVDFLPKPVKDKDLLRAIEQALARAAH